MIMTYRHTQAGWLPIVASSVTIGVALLMIALAGPNGWLVFGLTVMVAVLLLFGWLTVEVDGSRLRLRFGIGLFRKSFPLEIVRAARVVRNRWWYGWGIRWTPHGWLFNVSGLDAVELELTLGRRYRIGTDDPDRLAAAVRSAIRERR